MLSQSLAQSRMSYRTWQSLPVTKYKAPVVLQFLLILYSDQEAGHNVKSTGLPAGRPSVGA